MWIDLTWVCIAGAVCWWHTIVSTLQASEAKSGNACSHCMSFSTRPSPKSRPWMSSIRLKLNPSNWDTVHLDRQQNAARKDWQTGTAATLSRDRLRNKRHGPGCRHWMIPGIRHRALEVYYYYYYWRGSEDGRSCWRITRSCFYQLRQIRTIRQSLSDNATRTLIHSFVVTIKGWLLQLGPIWHHCSTDRTSSENFECSGSSRASNSEVRTSIGVYQRQCLHWLPAAQRIKFKILLYWSQTASTKEHRFICMNSVCWFQRCRGVDTYGMLTSSAWWSIAVGYHRCRSGDLLLLDRWRGTICQRLYMCFDSQEQ